MTHGYESPMQFPQIPSGPAPPVGWDPDTHIWQPVLAAGPILWGRVINQSSPNFIALPADLNYYRFTGYGGMSGIWATQPLQVDAAQGLLIPPGLFAPAVVSARCTVDEFVFPAGQLYHIAYRFTSAPFNNPSSGGFGGNGARVVQSSGRSAGSMSISLQIGVMIIDTRTLSVSTPMTLEFSQNITSGTNIPTFGNFQMTVVIFTKDALIA